MVKWECKSCFEFNFKKYEIQGVKQLIFFAVGADNWKLWNVKIQRKALLFGFLNSEQHKIITDLRI